MLEEQIQNPCSLQDTTSHTDSSETELVRSLREQNHRLFLQINEMEKFGLMEADHIRTELEDSQREWRKQEDEYKAKLAALENKLKQRQLPCGAVIVDLGELDNSNFFDTIEHVDQSLQDSAFEKLQQWLTENQKSPADELDQRLKMVQRLRNSIYTESRCLSPIICELIQFCNQLSIQACGLKEQLKNCFDSNEVSKCKIQQAYALLSKCKLNQTRFKNELNDLKEQTKFWRGLYEAEVNRKQEIENTLYVLEKKVRVNETENMKLQEIIKDQSSRIEILSHANSSLLGQNCQMNDSHSRTTNNISNISSLSNFLEKALKNKASPKKTDKPQPFKHTYRMSCESPVSTANNMFKKKPFLHKFEN